MMSLQQLQESIA
jgi:hypothetical protein